MAQIELDFTLDFSIVSKHLVGFLLEIYLIDSLRVCLVIAS